MKGKITDSLKTPLTKGLPRKGYWKLNEMPESSQCLRQKDQFEETMANEQSQNGRGEYQIDEITYSKVGLMLMGESREL